MLRASVVVPTYDRLTTLRELLEQLDRQTLAPADYEVIVVDDGSAVDVGRHLRASDYSFALRVERQPNRGRAAARQLGADRASGDVLVFVDDDMRLPPRFLEAHLAQHPHEPRLVVLGRLCTDEGKLPLTERYRIDSCQRLADDAKAGQVRIAAEHLYSGNMSLPRSLLAEVGGFDPALPLIEDVELGIRLEQAGARFVICDDASCVHRCGSADTSEWFERAHEDGVHWSRIARKHRDSRAANPWHFMDRVNPVSCPLLLLSALAPAAGTLLARAAFATARAADGLGLDRVASAGMALVYNLHLFRGVGVEAGGPRGALCDYVEFRRRRGA